MPGVKKRIKVEKKRSGIKSKFVPRDPEPPEVIAARWEKKKDRIHQLAHNISRLRLNVSNDLKSDEEKEFLVALIIAIIDKTGERIGNNESAKDGHYGISGLLKKHISIDGNRIVLTYTGKSGVDQEKAFSSEKIANALRRAIKNSPDKRVFTTTKEQWIGSDQVNRYLKSFDVSAKDLRGFYVNKALAEKLEALPIPGTEKERKKLFNATAKKVAKNVGHGCGTCKKHYIVPELQEEYITNGRIIDLKSQKYYKGGGRLESKQLLAPNGKPSNLSTEQHKLVRTPEFKKWFGDWENDPENSSKVLDRNGEPQVANHYSDSPSIDVFKMKGDEDYSRKHSVTNTGIYFNLGETIAKYGKYPYYVFLNFRNPLKVRFYRSDIVNPHTKKNIHIEHISDEDVKFLKENGYDSVMSHEGQVVAISPNQIKLADGTNTTFNPNNPDIRYAKGGIPDRYKNMGFSQVGQKKKSTRPQKKWMVLAKKGDQYKVVHGGQKGMKDFSQHHDKDRQKRFWNRMGGFDSEKASDPFSPLYWHKRFGTWENGGVLEDGTFKVAWIDTKEPETLESKMFDSIDDALKYAEGKTFLIMELEGHDGDHYKWNLLPYGEHKRYKGIINWMNIFEEGGMVENNDFANSEKSPILVPSKITKDEIKHVISGEIPVRNGGAIQAAANYLRRGKGRDDETKNADLVKREEEKRLGPFITSNNLWLSRPTPNLKLQEGFEQKVYFFDTKSVIKTNSLAFYNSWEEYFTNLLLHNYFFEDTTYELIGFVSEAGRIYPVVKQPLIRNLDKVDPAEIKKLMSDNGFINTRRSDYEHPELGIIIEDLHDENVVKNKGVIQFIDTVFYIKPDENKLDKGGKITTESQKQIQEYIQKGEFISPNDKPVVGVLPISRFNGPNADIHPNQQYVYIRGVAKWKIKIREGLRPHILIDHLGFINENRVIDGHHRLAAYEQLGITDIPVIDRNGKVLNPTIGIIKQREILAHGGTIKYREAMAARRG